MPQADNSRPRAVWLRGVAFVLVALYLFSGCVVRQVLRRDEIAGVALDMLPRWVMFGGSGIGLTQYRYERVDALGRRAPVDVFEALELDPLEQPRDVWRVRGNEALHKLTRRLCRALARDPETQAPLDLRVESRTATRKGWRREKLGARDVCRRDKRKRSRTRAQKKPQRPTTRRRAP